MRKYRNVVKGLLTLALCAGVGSGLFAGGKEETGSSSATAKEAPKVVRFGIYSRSEFDPTYVDPNTGNPTLMEEPRRVLAAAEKAVLDQLNVKIEWVEYPTRIQQDLIQSIFAGKPLCDVAYFQTFYASQQNNMYNDTMQDITPYQDIFLSDPESSWMLLPPIFGKRLLIDGDFNGYALWPTAQMATSPLVFNINYVEAVDALKENGKTVYPTDLYKQGKWTWSKFEEYLEKVAVYYKNRPTPDDAAKMIKPYQTDYRRAAENALHTAGQAIYGNNGVGFNTPEGIEAIEFVIGLYEKGLANTIRADESKAAPADELTDIWTFAIGDSVFSDIYMYLAGVAGQELGLRGGMSMGTVPWPRPDYMEANDPRYQMPSEKNSAWQLLKGVSAEQSRLALQALKVYAVTWLREEAGGVKSALDYRTAMAETNAIRFTFDIFHPVIGQDVLAIWTNYSPFQSNEMGRVMGIYETFGDIMGGSIYGIDGAPRYSVNVQQKMPLIDAKLDELKKAHP